MSWLVDLRRFANPQGDRIGPGRLIAVVGPSGSGKDTLILGARAVCADDSTVVFPQRVVTRPPSPSEDNAAISEQAFHQSVANGDLALWWTAHGHHYGIPSSIDDDIRASRTVVCNMSRGMIGFARRRYAWTEVVLITAPAPVLEARLASRRRPSDGRLESRLARSAPIMDDTEADFIIHNVRRPAVGVRRLVNIIRAQNFFVIS